MLLAGIETHVCVYQTAVHLAEAGFRDQFTGKSIVDARGKAGIAILRGRKATADNEVDGITGATMTSQKVEAMLNNAIERIVKVRGSGGG